jgi:hypothetical protein
MAPKCPTNEEMGSIIKPHVRGPKQHPETEADVINLVLTRFWKNLGLPPLSLSLCVSICTVYVMFVGCEGS